MSLDGYIQGANGEVDWVDSWNDALRLIVHPIILGDGKALFAGVRNRRTLELDQSRADRSGRVVLTYRI
jgi:dihydrofolate reductase